MQQDGGGNGSRPGEHWHGQRGDGDVVLGGAGDGFFLGFLHQRALRAQHVQRNEQQHDAAGHLKGRQGDAEQLENPLPGHREHQQHAGHYPAGQSRHVSALLGGVVGSHGQERRHGADRVHNHKE